MLEPLQPFLRAPIAPKKGQCEAILLGSPAAVSLFLEQFPQIGMRLECWPLFNRSDREIATHQADAKRRVPPGIQEQTGAIHERLGAVYGCGLDLFECLLHLRKAVREPQKDSEVEPCSSSSMGRTDAGPI